MPRATRQAMALFQCVVTVLCVLAMILCVRPVGEVLAQVTNNTKYVGDLACSQCHSLQSQAYQHTSHHFTSQLPSHTSVLGSFKPGENTLVIANPPSTEDNPRLSFQMDFEDGRFYETAIAEKAERRLTHSEPIDIVIGSGTRGQTYLFWAGNELMELPVSYWKDGNQWINSPGYADGTANFQRHVNPRCLECHSTFIQPLSSDPQTNVYDRSSFVAGISCESCHGPGARHIDAEKASRSRSQPSNDSAILNPSRLTRDRQLDQCALCHNGTERAEIAPAFSYIPGQPLDKYLGPNPSDVVSKPDVHGNQVGLLKKSRCYLESPGMTCSTCHDVHQPERAPASYSDRCLTCHQWQSCGVARTMGIKIKQNCVDCHMPLQQTAAIVSVTANRVVRASIRTHWIKVYP